jgi:uncharacterized protein
MYQRLLNAPQKTFFLFGMRGTGKSTWARGLSTAATINLLDERLYQSMLADAGLFARRLLALPAGSRVVVDEVQRLPSLLNDVHRMIEERDMQFALLGSSARQLRRAGVNLLGGRAVSCTMFPLQPTEMGPAYDIDQVMRFGSLPLVAGDDDPSERITAYVETYLKEEIKAEALVRNLSGFARFLPIASLFHGQVISVENVARDCGVQRTTVHGFLDILEDTLLTQRLSAFEKKLRVKQRHHPKLYWLDPGVARGARQRLSVPTSEEQGPLLEGLVFQWLQAMRGAKRFPFDDIGYFATNERGTEVDFVLTRGDEHIAIEVKATRSFRQDHARSLRALRKDLPLQRAIVVTLGSDVERTDDDIDVWPWRTFTDWLDAGGPAGG